MILSDRVVCGTSTTGTGTLTLAASPAPPGGNNFDKWLKATGYNFVSTNAVLVSYTIIEYSSNTFATATQMEKGVGTLTLGASITAATLARSTVQYTITGLNGTPAPTYASPTAITIGTAANTLVFVGISTSDLMPGIGPYFDSATLTAGLSPVGWQAASGSTVVTNGNVIYTPFYWILPRLVKTLTTRVGNAAYTGGTSNVYGAFYDTNSSGKPGKLLIDFGVMGTAGSSLSTTFTNIPSAAHASGFFMAPGLYWSAIFTAFSGGSGTPALQTCNPGGVNLAPTLGHSIWGLDATGNAITYVTAAATANPAPDPAGTTSYTYFTGGSGSPSYPIIWLS